MVVGALLYYRRAVDNKILMALSVIGSQQSEATENTKKATNMLLDYCATYPNDGIKYRSSDMVRCGHSEMRSTTKVDPEVGLVHTYSFLKMTTSQDGMTQC